MNAKCTTPFDTAQKATKILLHHSRWTYCLPFQGALLSDNYEEPSTPCASHNMCAMLIMYCASTRRFMAQKDPANFSTEGFWTVKISVEWQQIREIFLAVACVICSQYQGWMKHTCQRQRGSRDVAWIVELVHWEWLTVTEGKKKLIADILVTQKTHAKILRLERGLWSNRGLLNSVAW